MTEMWNFQFHAADVNLNVNLIFYCDFKVSARRAIFTLVPSIPNSFLGFNLENPGARIRAVQEVSIEIRNFSTSHGLVFQKGRGGGQPQIIRITRSCRTESQIGCIGIRANSTCWRLTIGGVAMISDEQGRADGTPERRRTNICRLVWARGGASHIRHLRPAVTRGFRSISLVLFDNFANGHSTAWFSYSPLFEVCVLLPSVDIFCSNSYSYEDFL